MEDLNNINIDGAGLLRIRLGVGIRRQQNVVVFAGDESILAAVIVGGSRSSMQSRRSLPKNVLENDSNGEVACGFAGRCLWRRKPKSGERKNKEIENRIGFGGKVCRAGSADTSPQTQIFCCGRGGMLLLSTRWDK